MRLDCKHVWPYISDYIDDTVTPEERRAIEEHLEHCEICSAILDSVHNILVLTADERVFRLPLGYSERLHERIRHELVKVAPNEVLAEFRDGDDGSSSE